MLGRLPLQRVLALGAAGRVSGGRTRVSGPAPPLVWARVSGGVGVGCRRLQPPHSKPPLLPG